MRKYFRVMLFMLMVTLMASGSLNAATVTNIAAGSYPDAVGVNPVTNKIYAMNYSSGTVTVIDGATKTAITTLSASGWGGMSAFQPGSGPYYSPSSIAVNPITNRIYIAHYGTNNVTVINGTTDTVIGVGISVGTSPMAIAVNSETNKIYVANNASNSVSVINGITNSVEATIPVGTEPRGLAVNPVTNKIYVANSGSNSVSVIDGAANSVSATIGSIFSTPERVVVNPVTNKIYVGVRSPSNLTIINGADNTTATTSGMPISGFSYALALAVNPVTNMVYVADGATSGKVAAINGADNSQVAATISVNNTPGAMAINPVTNTLYIGNQNSTYLNSIDCAAWTTSTSISISGSSWSLSVNPTTNTIYTGNYLGYASVNATQESATPAVPLATTILPLDGDTVSFSTPSFDLTTTTGTNWPAVRNVYYQLDSTSGTWLQASKTNTNLYALTTAPLSVGTHTLYAFATDGQDSTSNNSGPGVSPLVGALASYTFTVTGPPPPVDGTLTATAGNRSVALSWTAASSAVGVASYKVAWGINGFAMLGDCSTGTDVGNVTSYNHTDLINGQTYYYRVCAVDTNSAVSAGVTASAAPSLHTLTVTKSGSGAVKSQVAGIDCGATCSASMDRVVTLLAQPSAGNYFTGWTGDCVSSALSCSVTMDTDKTVTATFSATPPTVVPTWNTTMAAAGEDHARAVRQTADGGSVVVGNKSLAGGTESAVWVLKYSPDGTLEWQSSYQNGTNGGANDIQQTADGGYIVAGYSYSGATSDAWILKLTASGMVEWQNLYGTNGNDSAASIQQTVDGGYIFTGTVANGAYSSLWVVKLGSAGAVQWENKYATSNGIHKGYAIQQTGDGGYIVAGQYDVSFPTLTPWALKLAADGSITWQERFVVSTTPVAGQLTSIRQTSDGGYIAGGKNGNNAWLVKLGASGGISWQYTYNYLGTQGAATIVEATDGSFTVATSGALANVSADGATLNWQNNYAFTNSDTLSSVVPTADGGFLAVGTSGIYNESNLWLLKVNATGGVSGWSQGVSSSYSTSGAGGVTATATAVTPAAPNSTTTAATATPQSFVTLKVVKNGAGFGLISSAETPRPTVDCGTVCTAAYPLGSVVNLTATPISTSSFGGWSGAGCSTGTCSITLSADTTISASFSNHGETLAYAEAFNAGSFPADWTTTSQSGSDWTLYSSANSPLAPNVVRGGGGFMSAGANSITELVSSIIDLSTYTNATLVFKADGGSGRATVDVSSNGGRSWTNVLTRDANQSTMTTPPDFTTGSTTTIVDISAAAGSDSALLRFNFVGADGNNWNIDDVQVYGTVIPIGDAVDAPALTWKTGGNTPWKNQSTFSKDGVDAAQSGALTDNQLSWLETTVDVANPALLSFWWSVSSEPDYDYLRFYIDGVEQAAISGGITNNDGTVVAPLPWQQKFYSLAPGMHTLRWAYSKDESVSKGADAAWVDMVELCEGSYAVTPAFLSAGFAGGSQTFAITPLSGNCSWHVATPAWASADVTDGTGAATVTVTINPGAELYGTILVADKTIPVIRSGSGGLDATFNPPDMVITTAGTSNENASLLYPANNMAIFYKVSVEGSSYTIQRRLVSNGLPLPGLGDGTIDGANPGFNLAGRIVLPTITTDSIRPTHAALQPDGKIVVMGYLDATGTSFRLLRLNVDGDLDSTFGGSGVGYIDYGDFPNVSGGTLAVVPAVLYLNAGKIVVAVTTNGKAGVAGLTPDGLLDWSYTTSRNVKVNALKLDAGGRILLAGNTLSGDIPVSNGWLLRLDSGGIPDATFGSGGTGEQLFSNGTRDSFADLVFQSDTKIVIVGESGDNAGTGFVSVLRYTDGGTLDSGFATNGVLLHGGSDVGGINYSDWGQAAAVLPNGNIVVGASEWSAPAQKGIPAYFRLTSNGSIDSTYGYGGLATFGEQYGVAGALAPQPDGKILSAGYSGTSNVSLRQTGGTPTVSLTPDANYPFAAVELPNGRYSVVTIRNSGDVTLDISAITLTGASSFSLDLSWDHGGACGIANPKLLPGASCDVLVSFYPLTTGSTSATLTIVSNDSASPATLLFNGTATPDVTPPVDGATFTAFGGHGFAALSWDTASDNSGVTGYKLVHAATDTLAANCTNGTVLYSGANQTFSHFDLTTGVTNYYRVCAFDAAGNISAGITASAAATGATKVWNLAADGNWEDPVNWTPAGVPTSADDVLINTGTHTITLNSSVVINSLIFGGTGTPTLFTGATALTINSSARIKAGASLVNTSVVSVNGNFMSDGSINGVGELFLSNAPNALFSAASPVNLGKLTLYNSSATVPTGSTLGELKLWTVSLPASVVTLTDNLVTANTTLTVVNSNNTINGPGTITNSAGKTLDLSGVAINTNVHNAGTINVTNSSSVNGGFTTQPGSALNISLAMGSLTFTNGFSNFGDITITPSNMSYPGYLQVLNGILTNESGATLTVAPVAGAGNTYVQGELLNAGEITINQNTYINKLNANHVNSGTLTIQNGAKLAIERGTFLNNTSGLLQGNGTLDLTNAATFTSNAGTVSGGSTAAPDKLTILGSLPNSATASTRIGIGQPSGRIDVSGSATLAGSLDVSLVDFYPSIGDKFRIMTCGTSCNGAFDALNLQSPGSGLSWRLTNVPDWSAMGGGAVTTSRADHIAMTIAPDGTPFIAYADQTNALAKMTVKSFKNNVWSTVGTPEFSGGIAYYSAIAVAPDGTPYVAYQDGGAANKVTVKKFDGLYWSDVGNIPFSTNTAWYTSLKIAQDGTPFLAYIDDFGASRNVTVRSFRGGNWVPLPGGTLPADMDSTSLAFAPDGALYLAYRGDSTQSYQSQVIRLDGVTAMLVGGGSPSAGGTTFNSLAIAPDGTPYVAYADEATVSPASRVTVRKYDGFSWVDVGMAGLSSGVANNVSLAVTTSGVPYLAYDDRGADGSGNTLTTKMFDGSNWVATGASGGSADYVSLGIARDGGTYLSFADLGNGGYATLNKLQGAVTLDAVFEVLPTTLPAGLYGAAYSQSVSASGGTLPYAYTILSGSLPPGLVLDNSTGLISGTPTAAGSYNVTIRVTDSNGVFVDMAYPLAIAKATPVITTWPTASAITYGQTLANSTLSGEVTITAGTFAFSAPSTAPGGGTAAHNVTFTPTDSVNYSSASNNVSVTVNKAAPTISVWPTASAITYGQTLADSTLSGGSASVPGAFAFTTPSTAPNAGSTGQSVTFTPSDTANYSSSNSAVPVVVAKATPVVSWSTPAAITYGTLLSGSQLNATTAPAGSFSYTPASGTLLTAGSQSLSVTFTPTDTANYNSASASTSLTVDKAVATITLANTTQDYDGTLKTVSITTVPAGLSHLVTYDGSIAAPIAAGSYAVAVSISDPNYSGSSSGTLTINKATPVITWATPAAVPVGTSLSATQLNASSGAIAGTFAYTPANGTVMNSVGSQTLSVSFTPSDSANYTSQTATVNLTVTDKVIPTLTWATPPVLTYGTALDATQLNATSGGVAGSFTYTPSAGTVLATGTQTLSVTFTPTDTITYSSTSATVNLTVNKAVATVNLGSLNLTYDGSLKTVSTTTVPTGLSTLVTYDGSIAAPIAAGSYAVVASVGDPNYSGSASGTLIVAKATPVISWANPAAITYGTPLSGSQLNASAAVPGTFDYSPASGTMLNSGTGQSLTVTFTPTDSANYTSATKSVVINVSTAATNQVTTGTDGITTVPATITAGGSTISIPAGTQLLDNNGNPVSGTLTVAATVLPSAAQLPAGLATAQTSDGKSLTQFGASIDITISAGGAQVKKITPAMVVTLPVPSTFAMDGTTVSYYSFDGSHWNFEGTAVVSGGSIAMQVSHLSVWAVAAFAVDTVPPTVGTVDLPATTTTLTVPVNAVSATDNVGVAGYLLTESAVPPPPTAPGWSATVPPDYQCRTWGNNIIYTYAKDTADNVSTATTKVVFVGIDPVTDGVIVPAAPTAPVKLEPVLADALKSLNFAMKIETPSSTELQHGKVAPLVNGIPTPDTSRSELNLGDTIVILRRVVGL